VVDRDGEKLSKQTLAAPIARGHALSRVWDALHFLGHAPPAELKAGSLPVLWAWAFANWRIEKVPRLRAGTRLETAR